MTPYDVFLRREVLDFLRGLRAAHRDQLIEKLKELGSNPHTLGDYNEFDEAGRAIQVAVHRRFAILYWADHAVKEL